MSDDSEDSKKPIIKEPTTFGKQVEILKERKLIIEDDNFALNVLSKINYYRYMQRIFD